MIGINSNINSLIAQQNLNGTQSALSSAITRLSSGKRINSAADDAAGQAIASRMTSQINGLNQGISNANDGVSMTQTASSGLSQITDNLQRIRQLAVQSATGSLSPSDQAALQKEVTQRIAEVNRIASQTTYNGTNVLDGTAGQVTFQVGANVGQTISIDMSHSVSAAKLGTGLLASGSQVATLSGLSLDSSGAATTNGAKPSVTSINVLADGKGGFKFTDQNNVALSNTAVTSLFGTATAGAGTALTLQGASTGALGNITSVPAAASANVSAAVSAINSANAANGSTVAGRATSGQVLGTISGLSLDSSGGFIAANESGATITSVVVKSDGAGGFSFADQDGNSLSTSAQNALFGTGTAATTTAGGALALQATIGTATTNISTNGKAASAGISLANSANVPPRVADIDISTTAGANQAIEAIDNALNSVNGIQADLGAAQNRFSSIAATQTAQSTNLSSAQSQITDANFAQETANLSKAQVLQQAGISVLAQANSMPQQVLKLLG
ncbi:flagellin N-terminal helical domain-containing protein [Caballeronia insecticola]|uniref:Flagellin n=1 Tax=Caballeronia insecticola TaxID=758793 RepID=R4WSK7_9BURK|nr:flagellin [Caballeronia insecticola]BAN21861.1 flagellin [Caballeronia insecticola]BAN85718.1 flagellin [Caballeronia insecticola]